MHAPLKLEETATGADACTLALGGELDLATAPAFREAVGGLLGSGCRHLVVDLADTTFVDSSGLGALLWAAHRLRAAGGDLSVVRPTAQTAELLRITGLGRLLT
jgi:anti-sigma B factor antagonist